MKSMIQQTLRQHGWYERVRASHLCDLYWTLSGSRVIAQRREELGFYRDLLVGFRQGDVVFDIGANDGTKSDVFLRLGARVVAVDPDEHNAERLRRRFLAHRLTPKPVTIVPKAVSDTAGTCAMWINAPGSAQNTLSDKWVSVLQHDDERFGERFEFADRRDVQTVTLDGLMKEYGTPFFIKIDVEGFEPTVLRGLRRPVPFLSFEVNLPEFRPEGAECITLLHGVHAGGRFNFVADCRRGLVLDRWLDAAEFAAIFEACAESSIEVFWRAS